MPPRGCWRALCAAGWLLQAASFPGWQDPVTVEPPPALPASARLCAKVAPVVDAVLLGYGQVARGAYAPPSSCGSPWARVLLELDGFVRGVQFDRYGAVWLRGVELLRTTTPEPSRKGIEWHVTKDVTGYGELFREAGEVALTIPNVVTTVYTGKLHVNISLSFYADDSAASAPPAERSVVPLRNLSGSRNPFGEIAVNGPVGQVNSIRLPRDTIEARLDLYASGHGCEEFWYTNPLEASEGGDCSGGAYRELTVFVDGQLAGAAHPFPVIYTGGVNPLLWRPLVGIQAFDVPAYEFDLTPFLAWLTDGEDHNITLAVLGNNPSGTWFLDGVLSLRRDALGPTRGGAVEILEAGAAHVAQAAKNVCTGVVLQTMEGRRSLRVRGSLVSASGELTTSELAAELSAESASRYVGDDTTITEGKLHSRTTSTRNGLRVTTEVDYPFYIYDDMEKDNETVQWNASVRYAYSVVLTYSDKRGIPGERRFPPYSVAFYNGIDAAAFINFTTVRPRHINKEEAGSSEEFRVWAGAPLPPQELADRAWKGGGLCCERLLNAVNGSVTEDRGECNCTWPRGLYACGARLCGDPILTGGAGAPMVSAPWRSAAARGARLPGDLAAAASPEPWAARRPRRRSPLLPPSVPIEPSPGTGTIYVSVSAGCGRP